MAEVDAGDIHLDGIGGIDVRVELARIDRERAETQKFVADQRKLMAEADKLSAEQLKFGAEQAKLYAEAFKLDRDWRLSPWFLILASAGAIRGFVAGAAAIINAFSTLMRR